MHMTPLQWILAVATPALELLLIINLFRKGLDKKFPIFLNFLIFSVVATLIPTVAYTYVSPTQYFYIFWSLSAVGMVLSLGIIYEVFMYMLRSFDALLDFARVLFRWAALFLLLASVMTALATTGSQQGKICTAVLLFERVVEMMQCGILLLIVLFESRLGLSWRDPAVGIATGTGLFAAADLCINLLAERMPAWREMLGIGSTLTSALILIGFVYVIMNAESETKTVQNAPSRLVLQRWNEVLMSTPLVGRKADDLAFPPVDSFIPGVEKAVERVLARKMSH